LETRLIFFIIGKEDTFDQFIFEMVLIDIRIVFEKLLLFNAKPTFEYYQKIMLTDLELAALSGCPIFLTLAEIWACSVPDIVAQAARTEMF
jgi:hypothetical protein